MKRIFIRQDHSQEWVELAKVAPEPDGALVAMEFKQAATIWEVCGFTEQGWKKAPLPKRQRAMAKARNSGVLTHDRAIFRFMLSKMVHERLSVAMVCYEKPAQFKVEMPDNSVTEFPGRVENVKITTYHEEPVVEATVKIYGIVDMGKLKARPRKQQEGRRYVPVR